MLERSLIFIGYRGTGKTTLGRLLARRLDCPFIDTDPVIERRAGKTIAEIFREDGEPAFRDLEETVIADYLRRGPLLLAPGGGAILRETTRKRMRRHGTVVWLTVSPETSLARMSGDATSATRRPELTNLPPLEEIREVLGRRLPLYRETAHLTLNTEEASPSVLANRLLVLLKGC